MQKSFFTALVIALVSWPGTLSAQHGGGGRGGGGGGRGGGGRGGFQGGGFHGGGPGGGAPHAPAFHGAGPAGHAWHGGPTGHQFAYGHRPAYHGGWYHGDWHGYWGHPWGYRPWGWYGGGWGLGFGWGLGTGLAVGVSLGSPWGWGYYPYWNPYWVPPPVGLTYINYAQPIVVAPPVVQAAPTYAPATATALPGSAFGPPAAQPPGQNPAAAPALTSSQQKAVDIFNTARSLFKRGDYPLALAETNRAIALVPSDTLMHEFRALCLFATKDYQQAAAAVYAVLSIGPGWDWATVSGLYDDPNGYTEQLRALENDCNEEPEAPHARFLLAYHYLLQGHNDEAKIELQAVIQLQPKDQLAAQLLKSLSAGPQDQPAEGPNLPAAAAPPAAPVEAENVIGDWKASRSDGSDFQLHLGNDKRFNWTFTQQGKEQQLSGTYTLANNFLILSATNQNALVGQVALEPGDKLRFKLAGGSSSDPGLTFTR